MDKTELIEKIISKKEFSKLPLKDVEMVFNLFDKPNYIGEEKVKLTRDLLRKVYTAFVSEKLLSLKNKDFEWVLKKHISTKERFNFYSALYPKLLKKSDSEKLNLFDLGAGVNGFSYSFLPKNTKYFAVEAVGQLVNLMNNYFKKNKYLAKAFHLSLFDLVSLKRLIKSQKGKKIIFLFKTLDSLEMIKKDYSKSFLSEITPLVDEVVVSFATKSLISKKQFKVKRNWILSFIKEKFNLVNDFELGTERYLVFSKK